MQGLFSSLLRSLELPVCGPDDEVHEERAAKGEVVGWQRKHAERIMQEALVRLLRAKPGLSPPPPSATNLIDWTELGKIFSEWLPVYVFQKPPDNWFSQRPVVAFDYEGHGGVLTICACELGVAIAETKQPFFPHTNLVVQADHLVRARGHGPLPQPT